MKGLFIPEITTEMFRNGCLEAIEALMAKGEIYDIDYDFKEREPCEDTISRQAALDAVFNNAESPNKAYKAIRILPSAQPEIIRCGECKYWRVDHTCKEHSLVSPMLAYDFCSRAERRTDGRD